MFVLMTMHAISANLRVILLCLGQMYYPIERLTEVFFVFVHGLVLIEILCWLVLYDVLRECTH